MVAVVVWVVVAVGVAVVVAVGVGVVVAVVVWVVVAVGVGVVVAVVVAMTAAIYIPKALRFHADVHCGVNLHRRGLVADEEYLRARKMAPCHHCWRPAGYQVTEMPEMWEIP